MNKIVKIIRKSKKNARVCLDNGEKRLIPTDLAIVGKSISTCDKPGEKANLDQEYEKASDNTKKEKELTLWKVPVYDLTVVETDKNIFLDKVIELETHGYFLTHMTSELWRDKKGITDMRFYAEFIKRENDKLENGKILDITPFIKPCNTR